MEKTPIPCPSEARLGQRLRGKWRLERLLGIGGTAAVYGAVHRNGMRGAVKILHAELKHNQESRGRFLYEGVVANRVKHAGIVAVLDDDLMEDDTPFLVMELLEGEAVHERMGRRPSGRLDVEDTCRIVHRLLDVLAAAHDAGVIHRDVKPENVFITSGGRIKLLDFGIAHVDDCPSKVVMTRFGYTMGTPAFMPPEQAIGDWANVGPATDLWAVGASMFNMLTGTLVHGEEALYKLMQRTATEPAPAIRAKMPELPEAVAAVVDRALAFEIKDRFQSAAEMQRALEEACPECRHALGPARSKGPRSHPNKPRLMLTASTTKMTRPPTEKRPRMRAAIGFGGAIVAAALLGSGSSMAPDGAVADDGRRLHSPAREVELAPPPDSTDETTASLGDQNVRFRPSGPPASFDGMTFLDEPAFRMDPPRAIAEPPVAPVKARKPFAAERAFRTRL